MEQMKEMKKAIVCKCCGYGYAPSRGIQAHEEACKKKTDAFCSGCGTIPCTQQNEKDNMISGMMIKSCSDWTNKEEKTSINPRLNIER